MITIEVAFSPKEGEHLLKKINLPDGATAHDAVNTLGWLDDFLAIRDYQIGIFAKKIDWQTPLKTGDRLEIHRPLTINPMQKRQKRSKKQRLEKIHNKVMN